MKRGINIAETEWKVMEVLWEQPMLVIGDIRAALAETGWSDSTIKTLVRRLVAKEALGIDDSQGQFRYYPLASRKECTSSETKSLIDRVYNGSVKMLMTSLVSESSLTEEEVSQLLALIDKMDGGTK